MEQYLIDTNVVSDYFSASLPAFGLTLLDNAINAIPNISIITPNRTSLLEHRFHY